MYSNGGGGGEQDDESDDCTRLGGGGMEQEPTLLAKGEDDVFVCKEPARVGLTAKGFGIGRGSCLSFTLCDDRLVGREDTLKANGGVTDFVRSLGL